MIQPADLGDAAPRMGPRHAIRTAGLCVAAALAAGCAAPATVDRIYDGHAVAGRAVEPEDYAAFFQGAIAEAHGQAGDARREYTRVADADPASAEVWTRLGVLECQTASRGPTQTGVTMPGGGTERPEGDFVRALELDPTYARAWAARSRCDGIRGAYDVARAGAQRAVVLTSTRAPWGADLLAGFERLGVPRDESELLVALAAGAEDTTVAWTSLAAWAAGRGDVPLWARAVETLLKTSPAVRKAAPAIAEHFAAVGHLHAAHELATVAAVIGDAPFAATERHALAARLALDDAIARGDAGSVRLCATRVHMALAEASARARLAGATAMSRALAREALDADAGDREAALLLAADAPDPTAISLSADRFSAHATVSGAAFVAFGVACLERVGVRATRAALAAISHGPWISGDDRVTQSAVELAFRGVLDPETLPPEGRVELAARSFEPPVRDGAQGSVSARSFEPPVRDRAQGSVSARSIEPPARDAGQASMEALRRIDVHRLDPRHEYLALAMTDPGGPRAADLARRLASADPDDSVIARARAVGGKRHPTTE